MLALVIPILNSVLGGIIKPFVAAWVNFEQTKLTTGEAGFAAAAAADSAVMQAALTADVQLSAMKVQVYGTLSYRVITLVARSDLPSFASWPFWQSWESLARSDGF